MDGPEKHGLLSGWRIPLSSLSQPKPRAKELTRRAKMATDATRIGGYKLCALTAHESYPATMEK
jgi:hypothetical protein